MSFYAVITLQITLSVVALYCTYVAISKIAATLKHKEYYGKYDTEANMHTVFNFLVVGVCVSGVLALSDFYI